MTQRSIVIGGGAFAGLALALALRQGFGGEIPVIVADPALGLPPSRDPRATAIVAACRRLFETLGAWDKVADGAQPILDMVVTDGHERYHHGRAEEHFLPAGPFAMLPLKGARSSLVWTESRGEAARLVALTEDEFHAELERRFGLRLGEIRALDQPRAFP